VYKKILVPLDGSERAEAILPHVTQIAACGDTRVFLMQVVEAVTVMPAATVEIQLDVEGFMQRTGEAAEYLHRIEKQLGGHGLEVSSSVEHGPIVETICDVAAREGADLIAMASHGRGGLSRVFYGSVASGVLQRVNRPLLLIRSRQNSQG
jgi:nucleotide-binding universal stress UspA family protein